MTSVIQKDPTWWLLPQVVRDVAEVIGRRQALRLAGAVCPPASPGRRKTDSGRAGSVYIPLKLRPGANHRLIEILGEDDAQRMVEAFPGMILNFPSCTRLARAHRDRAIRKMAAEGWSVSSVAWAFDVCALTVKNVVAAG